MDKCVDARILLLIGIAISVVLSGGTGVVASSNTTENNTKPDVGSAKELEQLTNNNSLTNLSGMASFNETGSNLTSNQTSN